jgi:predicted nucleotidyltransferase
LDQVIGQLRQMQIGVCGSYVRGEQTDGSDLDILVDLGESESAASSLSACNRI